MMARHVDRVAHLLPTRRSKQLTSTKNSDEEPRLHTGCFRFARTRRPCRLTTLLFLTLIEKNMKNEKQAIDSIRGAFDEALHTA